MRSNYRLKGSHYVATHGRLTPDPPYVHSNRGYSTDGDETHSHRAPSERTCSEYTLTHERISPQYNGSRKKRSSSSNGNHQHQHLQSSYSHSQMGLSSSPDNGGPRSLSGPPPTRQPPRAPSALSYDQAGDAGSDIYVTSAAYKAPSEIRCVVTNI